MNSYTDFAYLYDRLMKPDVDYNKLVDYIENLFTLHGKNPDIICDLACGTGNVTIPLAERGYNMIGVDRSYDMLSIAERKAKNKAPDILFLSQNITDLDLYGSADAFLCMIDGFNYILSPTALFNLFKKIRTCFIEPDGIFIFDISSRYKLSKVIGNNTFVYGGDSLFYTWQNTYRSERKISDMFLTFFKKEADGRYSRFEERHLQRAYSEKEIVFLLKAAGFERVSVYGEMSFDKPHKNSQRLVFAAEAGERRKDV